MFGFSSNFFSALQLILIFSMQNTLYRGVFSSVVEM